MAERLLTEIVAAVDDLITKAAQDMFGTGESGGNSATAGVDSIRWEGMSDAQLAAAVRQLNSGPGAAGIQQAADALSTIADNLNQMDLTLSTQLKAIGVNWQSEAAELAAEMGTAASSYATSAGVATGTNAAAVTAQGEAFTAARNAVPHPSTLESPPNSFMDAAGGLLTGHETDQAPQAAKYAQARQQAVDTMNTYTSQSQSHLASHAPLPKPYPVTHTAHGVDTSIGQQGTTVSSFAPPTRSVPGGTSGGAPGLPGVPGGGGVPGVPTGPGLPGSPVGVPGGSGGLPGVPGGGVPGTPGLPGGPGGGGGVPGVPGTPGVPGLPGTPGGGGIGGGGGGTLTGPLGPGPVSGIGTPGGPPVAEGMPAAPAAGGLSGSLVEDTAIGTAIVGGAVGAGIGGAAARKDRLVRSRQLGEPVSEVEGEGDARQQAARALLELEGDEAAEAGASARIGATAEPPPSLLEPAVGQRSDDDGEHRDRYAESEDMFADGRMVIPGVLDGSATPDPDDPK
ncbi:MAG TPA: PPE domain-containing protein [Pseudonocardiaceae bacterium]|nr:PPE domain-containing protein [Pseudonocardiaceae bacterium]